MSRFSNSGVPILSGHVWVTGLFTRGVLVLMTGVISHLELSFKPRLTQDKLISATVHPHVLMSIHHPTNKRAAEQNRHSGVPISDPW